MIGRMPDRIPGRESGKEKSESEALTGLTEKRGYSVAEKPRRVSMESTEQDILQSSLYRFEGPNPSHGGLAQLGERVLCKHEVIGSSPIFSTTRADSSVG